MNGEHINERGERQNGDCYTRVRVSKPIQNQLHSPITSLPEASRLTAAGVITFSLVILLLTLIFPTAVIGWDTGYIKSISIIAHNTKSLDWSFSGNNLVALGKKGVDSYYDVYTMAPDGTNLTVLTHNKPGCPQKHNGNPVWHPSGNYLVFTAENENSTTDTYSIPGSGLNCNLWAMNASGDTFWQLTFLPSMELDARGVIHPQFSHDGSRLFWAERLGSGGSWGEWELKVADFVIAGDSVYLNNSDSLQPGDQKLFYESHAFSNDGSRVLFSGNLLTGQLETGIDIFEMDLDGENLTRLTTSIDYWDEHAHYSPDGAKIVWMSSNGFDIVWGDIRDFGWKDYIISELWIMNADGSDSRRLTFFNQPGHPEYLNGARSVVSDNTWSPDGTMVMATVAYEDTDATRSMAVLIEFNNQPPSVDSVNILGFVKLNLTFNQSIDTVAAIDTSHYSVSGGIEIIKASALADSAIQLTISPIDPTDTYTLTVRNIAGLGQVPAMLLSDTHEFQAGPTGDFTGDRIINLQDYLVLLSSFGARPGNDNWNDGLCDIAGPGGSLGSDNKVGLEDLLALAFHFGR